MNFTKVIIVYKGYEPGFYYLTLLVDELFQILSCEYSHNFNEVQLSLNSFLNALECTILAFIFSNFRGARALL